MNTDDRTDSELPILQRQTAAVTPLADDTEVRVNNALEQHRSSFLVRLFPDELDREIHSHELSQLRTGFEYRRKALEMAVETRLQAVEEMCNHVLVTGKSEIRRRRQEFFTEQMLQLEQSMNRHAERFQTEIEQRYDALERLRDPRLKEREAQRLDRRVDEFNDLLEELSRDFVEIVREGVSR